MTGIRSAGSVLLRDLRLVSSNPDKALLKDQGSFPDAKFRDRIADQLGKPFDSITLADAKNRTSLSLGRNSGVASLTGLEFFSGLKELNLDDNPFPSSDLDLITPARFPTLKRFSVFGAGAVERSFEPVFSLLSRFPCWEGIAFWSFPSLGAVDFNRLYQEILKPNGQTLTDFGINGERGLDLSLLTQLPHLKGLNIGWSDAVTSLQPISGMKGLTFLYLGGGKKITDLSPLWSLFQSGAFHAPNPNHDAGTNRIELPDCDLDLSPGTANRKVIDDLMANGVTVVFLQGNYTLKFEIPSDGKQYFDGDFYGWNANPLFRDATWMFEDPVGDIPNPLWSGLDVTRIQAQITTHFTRWNDPRYLPPQTVRGSMLGLRLRSAGKVLPSGAQSDFCVQFIPIGSGPGVDLIISADGDSLNGATVLRNQYSYDAKGDRVGTDVGHDLTGLINRPGDMEFFFPRIWLNNAASKYKVRFNSRYLTYTDESHLTGTWSDWVDSSDKGVIASVPIYRVDPSDPK